MDKIYLTYNEQPSGIFNSQVLDVVDFMNLELNADAVLVSIISIRGFFRNRRIIKSRLQKSIVLPMFPKQRNWKRNVHLLKFISLFLKPRVIIARSVLATNLALQIRNKGLCKKVVYDGRGAIAAEWKEYHVVSDLSMLKMIDSLERKAINESNNRIAVSEALIDFWREEYGYVGNEHVVIPCTLDSKYFSADSEFSSEEVKQVRKELQVSEQDVLLAYAGSTAPWQSFALMESFLVPLMEKDEQVKMLFLSEETDDIKRLMKRFPGRVIQKWVEHKEVLHYLSAADYGLLLREESVTNKVASPTKFAEYLYGGLKVLITEQLGDFSNFVRTNNCGLVVSNATGNHLILTQALPEERTHNRALAMIHFKKENAYVSNNYLELMNYLNNDK